MFGQIDHMRVAVGDLDRALVLRRDRRGMPVQHRETVGFNMETVLVGVGDGIRRSRVAFMHRRSTGGVLTERVEPAEDH